jgi:hypothetical protein
VKNAIACEIQYEGSYMADIHSLLEESRWELKRLDDAQVLVLSMALARDHEGAEALARQERHRAANRLSMTRKRRREVPWRMDFSAEGLV